MGISIICSHLKKRMIVFNDIFFSSVFINNSK